LASRRHQVPPLPALIRPRSIVFSLLSSSRRPVLPALLCCSQTVSHESAGTRCNAVLLCPMFSGRSRNSRRNCPSQRRTLHACRRGSTPPLLSATAFSRAAWPYPCLASAEGPPRRSAASHRCDRRGGGRDACHARADRAGAAAEAKREAPLGRKHAGRQCNDCQSDGAIHARLLGLKALRSTPQPRAGSIR